jgi:hypothetical protein
MRSTAGQTREPSQGDQKLNGKPGPGDGAARTPLGARLAALRHAVVTSGAPLLGWDELEAEIAERRGGVGEEG